MAFFFVILILTEPRFGCSGVLNPFLYARYIIDAAPTEFFIVNFRSGYNRVDGRREKEKPARDTHSTHTYIRLSNRDNLLLRQHNRRYYGITSLSKRNRPNATASTVKSIKDSRFSLCMRMKAAITKQRCMQCHVETYCWETESGMILKWVPNWVFGSNIA